MRPHWVGPLLAIAVASASALVAAGAPADEAGGAPAVPALEVRQQVTNAATASDGLTIDMTVANRGGGSAENVTVTDTLPDGYEYLAAEPQPERLRRQLIWTLGPVRAGERRSLRLRLRPSGRGSPAPGAQNLVQVSFAGTLSSTAAVEWPHPVLQVAVSGPDLAAVGQPAALTIVVSNAGTGRARSVRLNAVLLSGLSHPGGTDLENPLDDLGPGQSVKVSLEVTPTRAGEGRIRLGATAEDAAPAERECTLHARQAQPQLQLEAAGPVRCGLGSPCHYEWTVRNNGVEAVRGLRLVVFLAEGVSFGRSSAGGAYDAHNHALCWDLAEVPAGGSTVVTWDGGARKLGDQRFQGVLSGSTGAVAPVTWSTTVVIAPVPAPDGLGQ
jgi:uncharacterized repeat protein (TIGR01451 family)